MTLITDQDSVDALFDIEHVQVLMDSFCDALGISASIIDIHGKILVASRWKRICTDFHRKEKRSNACCVKSDTELALKLQEGKTYSIYSCGNGLIECASPIIINNHHIANIFIGQFLLTPPVKEYFIANARQYDYDIDAYMITLDEVPILKETRLQIGLNFLTSLAKIIVLHALDRLEARHQITVAAHAQADLLRQQNELEQLIAERTQKLNDMVEILREREHLLQEAKKLAEDSDRTKSEFIASMSHEIRTPMNAVIGLTDLALKSNSMSKMNDYLHKIDNASHSLMFIINNILDFSKSEAGQMKLDSVEFYIHDIFDHIADLFGRQTVDKGIEMIFSISGNICNTMFGDYRRLEQVLSNLVHNAIKFTERGFIEISMHSSTKKTGPTQLTFSVQDSGIGINPDLIEQLFNPFVQADSSTTRKYGGTGLGLSICKRLVELMGGRIWAESTPGQGTVFYFTVVFECRPDIVEHTMRIPKCLHHPKILAVDHSPRIWKGMETVLNTLNFSMTVVDSIQNALIEVLSFGKKGKPYDIVIINWHILEKDEIKIIKKMTGRDPDSTPPRKIPKIILLSPSDKNDLTDAMHQAGVSALLQTPITGSHLIGSIMRMYGESVTDMLHNSHSNENQMVAKQFAGRRILLVEDNDANQQVTKEQLEMAKLLVEIASNGHEAIRKIHQHPFDAVLMDLEMPIMDGYTATRIIRQNPQFEKLPIIAMTAHAMDAVRQKCLDAGMNAYLAKPLLPEPLYTELARWIGPVKALQAETEVGMDGNDILLPDLPGVDVTKGLTHLNGNRTSYKKLLIRFYEQQRYIADEIKEACEGNDLQKAARLAHSIKGVAGTLGADDLQHASYALEEAIRHGTPQERSYWIEKFDALLEPVMNAIAPVALTDVIQVTPVRAEIIIDPEYLTPLLTELVDLLKDGISETDALMAALKEQLQTTPAAHIFQDLQKYVYGYDYFKALATVNTIANILKIPLDKD
ncbi:MAG: PocR ligand-binding domain-containing protein [Magnetococcus sp. YQC-5]